MAAAVAYSSKSDRTILIPVVLADKPIPIALRRIHAIHDSAGDRPDEAVHQINDAIARFMGVRVAVEEEQQEVRELIETNAAAYVEQALQSRERAEKRYRILGITWYTFGLLALVGGLTFVIISLRHSSLPEDNWINFAYVSLRAVIVIVLLGACARYAFTLGGHLRLSH